MENGLVLMTALPPTVGHQYLIEFASKYMQWASSTGFLYVMVSWRDIEPIKGWRRVSALREHFKHDKRVVIRSHNGSEMPQNPEEHSDFWNLWKTEIISMAPNIGYVFASETYGIELAKTLGAKFVPCNVYRETVNVTATEVRRDILGNFDKLLPEMKDHFKFRAVIFGAESCGKTTVSKAIAASNPSLFYYGPEWAREYLELLPTPEVTEDRMMDIVQGQWTIDRLMYTKSDRPISIQDTDLLSTIGYYYICGLQDTEGMRVASTLFQSADIYYVMPDTIPFKPDPLRYGGDKRESTTQFWIDLLNRYDCKYHVVQRTDRTGQLGEILLHLNETYEERFNLKALREFKRI
jgi:HTH-type transcriptional repressor of NAD biosynthesis genes